MNKFNSFSTATQDLLRRCGSKGLNIYALINRVEKEVKRKISEPVIIKVCESAVNKEFTGNPWPWFKKALICQYWYCYGVNLEHEWEKQKADWKKDEIPKAVKDLVAGLCNLKEVGG